jgi:ADP-ribosyl-[dinitrogen reductase] hydrolase
MRTTSTIESRECLLIDNGAMTDSIERDRGSLIGLAVSDALGTTLEFSPPRSFRPIDDPPIGGRPFELKPGEWTDDTSRALCQAESLVGRRGFDPAEQMERQVRWFQNKHMSRIV